MNRGNTNDHLLGQTIQQGMFLKTCCNIVYQTLMEFDFVLTDY